MKRVLAMAAMFLLGWATVSWAEAGPEIGAGIGADEAVAMMISAHGGMEAQEAVRSVHALGRIRAVAADDQGSYERYFAREGGLLRVQTIYARSAETRILNGARGMRASSDGVFEESEGMRYEAMVYQRMYLDLPYRLGRGMHELKYLGLGSVGQRKAHVVKLTGGGGPPMRAYIDAETGLLLMAQGFFVLPGGREAYLAAEFLDYREVSGVPMPFRIRNFGSGVWIAETEIERYEVNGEYPAGLFDIAP